jgi:Cytochrome c556
MIRILGVLSAVVLGATAVMAQNLAPIKERQELMKKTNDEAKVVSAMVKGETAFDAAKAGALLSAWEDRAKKVVALFPDDSKTGEKTRAKGEVWQNKADFDAKLAEYAKIAAEAKAAAGSADTFKPAYAKVIKSCDDCHEKYRAPRDRAG